MKLSVYKPSNQETTTTLKLEKIEDYVEVMVCDASTGKAIPGGHLLRINSNGTITRFNVVDEKLGFKLNKYGQIKLEE